MNFIYMLADSGETGFNLCNSAKSVLGLVGYVILGIKIVVPIILIVMGMLDLAKAVTEKKEDKIKESQMLLVKKAIAAVMVFLVMTIVTIVMDLINAKAWKDCKTCLVHPTYSECKFNADSE